MKREFLSYPLNSFWGIVITVNTRGSSQRKSGIVRGIRMLHFLKKTLGLGVGCGGQNHFSLSSVM